MNKLRGLSVHKFGYNGAVGTTATPVEPLGAFNWLQAADQLKIKAGGNAADTAAGAGAQEVRLYGLNGDGHFIEESVATAGASASAVTSQEFFRLFRAKVTATGTYGANNTADITVQTDAGTDLLTIQAGEGQSQYAAYTVPANCKARLKNIEIFVDSAKSTVIRMFARANFDDVTTPFSPSQLKLYFPGQKEHAHIKFEEPQIFGEKTDIWFDALVDSGTAGVAIDFEMEIIRTAMEFTGHA